MSFSAQTNLPVAVSIAQECLCINYKGPANIFLFSWLMFSLTLQISASKIKAATLLEQNWVLAVQYG